MVYTAWRVGRRLGTLKAEAGGNSTDAIGMKRRKHAKIIIICASAWRSEAGILSIYPRKKTDKYLISKRCNYSVSQKSSPPKTFCDIFTEIYT